MANQSILKRKESIFNFIACLSSETVNTENFFLLSVAISNIKDFQH